MTFSQAFLKEFDPEMATTRRVLERVPVDRLDWKPHEKSMSLGQLATHLAELPRWGLRIQADSFAVGSEKAPPLRTTADLLSRFDENVRQSREAIAAMTEEDLLREFSALRGEEVFFKLKRRSLLRRVLLNHTIHHRGQMTVYLRLNDVPLPSIYGPTADER